VDVRSAGRCAGRWWRSRHGQRPDDDHSDGYRAHDRADHGRQQSHRTYKLDGTGRSTDGPRRRGEVEVKSVAKVDGNKLVITSKRPGQDGAIVETTETWSLDAGMLTIEGTGGRGPTKRVYKKG
jgi:hypothetical protein